MSATPQQVLSISPVELTHAQNCENSQKKPNSMCSDKAILGRLTRSPEKPGKAAQSCMSVGIQARKLCREPCRLCLYNRMRLECPLNIGRVPKIFQTVFQVPLNCRFQSHSPWRRLFPAQCCKLVIANIVPAILAVMSSLTPRMAASKCLLVEPF